MRKSIFRMGVPVVGKNYFPSNIQGLPTWYEIRVTGDGYQSRSNRVDVMVAMNAQTYEHGTWPRSKPGGWLIYDSTWPRSRQLNREDITVIGIPAVEDVQRAFRRCACAHPDEEHRLRRRRRRVARHRRRYHHDAAGRNVCRESSTSLQSNMEAIRLGYDYAREHFRVPAAHACREQMDATAGHIIIDGNTAAGLGCVYAGATVGAWYPITPSTSLMDAFRTFCSQYRVDPETGKRTYCIIQAEDELAAIGMVLGCQLEWRALVHADERSRHFADERVHRASRTTPKYPAVIFNVQRTGSVPRVCRRARSSATS